MEEIARDTTADTLYTDAHTMALTAKSTTEATASDRVFNTAELLEDILLYLPLEDLLLCAPLVCKQWQSVGQGSINIRRALFLEPIEDNDAPVRLNPFLHHYNRHRRVITPTVSRPMLFTNPPHPVYSAAQCSPSFEWLHATLEGATNVKAFRERSVQVVQTIVTSKFATDRRARFKKSFEARVQHDALVPQYRGGYHPKTWPSYQTMFTSRGATGWYVLTGWRRWNPW